jgi:hypothetical protein
MRRKLTLLICTLALGTIAHAGEKARGVLTPHIEAPWWQVAGNPMDHKYAAQNQEPVDFAVWQAPDETWQLWSCIRNTTAGGENGKTRFFYRWQGKELTDADWQPMGIVMEADPSLGETPGGLQAPHVIKVGDTYHLFYGDWVSICHAISKDGKNFTRAIQPNGKTGMFSEGHGNNTRDVMLSEYGGVWYAYYTAYPNRQGMVYVRTTKDFKNWSQSKVVSSGGQAGTGPYSSECPHVVKLGSKEFYLFKTQTYGPIKESNIRNRGQPQTSVYRSSDPTMFGINQDDRYFLGTLPVAAPEIVLHQGQYYIAALNQGALNGVRIAKLQWVKK